MKSMKFTLFCFLALLFFSCTSSKIEINHIETGEKSAQELLESLSLEEKVGQLFVLRLDQIDLKKDLDKVVSAYKYGMKKFSSRVKRDMEKYQLGGYVIFGKNISDDQQLRTLIKTIKDSHSINPIIAVDEEGGRVARLAKVEALNIKNVGPMEDIGKTGDPENAYQAASFIGSYLADYGFTVDFAPVVDVNTNPENIVIGNRSFGSDPQMAGKMASAYLDGLSEHGIKGCIKHFPGHGDTKSDTHFDYVAVTKTWDELLNCELIPFKMNLDKAPMVMTAHLTMEKVTSDNLPATLSKEILTGKLRHELGYQGIIISDSLAMGAIVKSYGSGEAAVMALEAGNDIILMPYDFQEAYQAVLEAVKSGRISEERINESVLRVLQLKGY